MSRRRTIFGVVIAVVMACTLIVPGAEVAFAAGSTTATTTAQTTKQTSKDPYANYTGWRKIKGKYYYYKNGRKLRGIQKIDGKYVRLSRFAGVYQYVIGDKMDLKAQKYPSRTKYLILVNCTKHQVRIYKGKKNNWRQIKKFKCTTGKRSTPTPKGTYTIKAKGKYFNTGRNGRCWYYTQFKGNYLFHTVIYYRGKKPSRIKDGRLGISASHGCVRLSLKNAKWVYYNIPRKTKVIIY